MKWRISATIILFLIASLRDLSRTSQMVSAYTCLEDCQALYIYYSRFRVSNSYVMKLYTACTSKCRPVATTEPPKPVNTNYTGGTVFPRITRGGGVLPSVCGIQPATRRIVGGSPSRECEFPWVVSVISSMFCGGTILDSRHVLTAAHCFKDEYGNLASMSNVQVRVGSSNLANLKTYTIQGWHIHPKHIYDINDYDVAVLTLSQDLVYGSCVAPICLPNFGEDPSKASGGCWSAGWGVQKFQSYQVSNILLKVKLPIVPSNLCEQAYGSVYVNDLKVCAGDFKNGGIDTCGGDSGGPLMCKVDGVWVQHGIVSFGRGCAEVFSPGVYTKLTNSEIRDYIISSVQDVRGH